MSNCNKIEDFIAPCPRIMLGAIETEYNFRAVSIDASLGDDSEGQPYYPVPGLFQNAIVRYKANGHVYVFASDGIPLLITESE